jgi:GxxExxY protein
MAQVTPVSDGVRDPETYALIGAAMEVHRQLGSGFLEAVYREALAIELRCRAIPAAREVPIPIYYRHTRLGVTYRADFVCFGRVLVEIKAQLRLTAGDAHQVINYLKGSGLERGLLFNFGSRTLAYHRFVHTVERRTNGNTDDADGRR